MSLFISSFLLFDVVFVFFFFKQKTAYDMRISDWSSDVCSSDLIASKISAIQAATRQTLDASVSISSTIANVVHSAGRIREAMETQAQTVTGITAAVDETALAAGSMSTTIATIRAETAVVSTGIEAVERRVQSVGDRLGELQPSTAEFAAKIGG